MVITAARRVLVWTASSMIVGHGIAIAPGTASRLATPQAGQRALEVLTASRGNRECVSVSAEAGDSIQAAVNRRPSGTRFCLSGTFTLDAPIKPKTGQRFIGPARLTQNGNTAHAFDLKGANAKNVTVTRLELWGFEVSAVNCWLRTTVRRSNIHDNGRNGIGCGLENVNSDVLIVNNEVWNNGSTEELGQGSAGMKFASSGIPGEARSGVTVKHNHVHHNIGEGIWFDVNSAGDTIVRNTITSNSRSGVMYEVSAGPVQIRDNVVRGNNTSRMDPEGGIVVYSSRRASVSDNTFGDNENWGVKVRAASRGYSLFRIVVHHNTMNGDPIGGCELDGVSCWENSTRR